MASGFDSTGIATGLLGGINQNITQQKKNVETGDTDEFRAFQAASEDYQKSKVKATDEAAKIDTIAPTLRHDNDDSDHARLASLAVARDAVNNGWTDDRYTPFLQDAYDRTKADISANPKKWNMQPETGNDNVGITPLQDTNPANTAILKKFNPSLTATDVEQVRQNKIDRPYANVPGGVYGNKEQFDIKQDTDKANAMTPVEVARQNALIPVEVAKQTAIDKAKSDIEEQKSKQNEHKLGLDLPDSAFSDAPKPTGLLADASGKVNASDLDPNATDGGIHLNSAAPKDTGIEGLPPEAAAASTNNAGKFSPERYMDYIQKNDPTSASIIQGLVNGELPINANALLRPNPKNPDSVNEFFKYFAAAKRYDPTWSTTDFAARQKTANDYSPAGAAGKQVAANDTALGHVGLAYQAVDALNNGNVQALNKVANSLGAQTGSVAPVVFNSIMGRLAPEVVQAYRPSAGTGEEVEQARAEMGRDLSGSQGRAVLTTVAQALKSKMDTSRQLYINEMGPVVGTKKEFYTPEAKDTMDKLGLSTDISQQRQTLKATQPQAKDQTSGASNLPKYSVEEALTKPPGTKFILPNGMMGTVPKPAQQP